MNIQQSLAFGTEKLKNTKTNSASLDAEILLSFVLGKPKEFIYANPEYKISKTRETKYKKFITCRATGEPIAYLTGHKKFYGLDFLVNKNVLIPRPETELLVGEVLEYIKNLKTCPELDSGLKIKNSTLVDIGTGSGCIPIAIAKNLYNELRIMNYGLDISKEALKIAHQNAKLHKVTHKIKFIKSDLLKKILNTLYLIHNTQIIITANLPYLPAKIYQENYQQLKYEPRNSLLAGHDGLKYYRQLLNQIHFLITHPSLLITCFFEIDPSQTSDIKKLIKQYFSWANIAVKKDLAGLNRLVIVKLSQKHSGTLNSQVQHFNVLQGT